MLPFCLSAKTIPDAWFQLIYNLFDKSYQRDGNNQDQADFGE